MELPQVPATNGAGCIDAALPPSAAGSNAACCLEADPTKWDTRLKLQIVPLAHDNIARETSPGVVGSLLVDSISADGPRSSAGLGEGIRGSSHGLAEAPMRVDCPGCLPAEKEHLPADLQKGCLSFGLNMLDRELDKKLSAYPPLEPRLHNWPDINVDFFDQGRDQGVCEPTISLLPQWSFGSGQFESTGSSGASKRAADRTPTLQHKPRSKRHCTDFSHNDAENFRSSSSDGGDILVARPREELTFACPLYRGDQVEHMDCLTKRLMRIGDVKQHIRRKHVQSPHHQNFLSTSNLENHIRTQCAEPASKLKMDSRPGISPGVINHLQDRTRRMSPHKQWYAIWDVVCQGKPRPLTPYLKSVPVEAVEMVHVFWKQEGHQIVQAFLDGHPTRLNGIKDEYGIVPFLMDLLCDVQSHLEQRPREVHRSCNRQTHMPARDEPPPHTTSFPQLDQSIDGLLEPYNLTLDTLRPPFESWPPPPSTSMDADTDFDYPWRL
ncbi:hypothetical protein EDB81DRAFT_943252 [Dactylonectria macrodidyma]|uniref:Uncharacterized protein n=1 Tax=Dactylonectria macrodidyma TaxID=307937 RepID=A0A9P9JFV0_9HYPO|nr:hypothetical protein EDB81DRAFT_943252 [Dactylonectria macrodidyma]